MMNLYGGQGMGAAGTGMGGGGMVPGGGISPQLLAMLAQMRAQGAGGGAPGMAPGGTPPGMQGAPGPMQAPATGTPMSAYIGGGGAPGGGMMQHPPMAGPPPAGPVPGMGGAGPTQQPQGMGQAAGAINPQMLQMLQMLKQQQTGVQPQGGALPPGQNPNQNPLLQQLMGGGGQTAYPGGGYGAGGMT